MSRTPLSDTRSDNESLNAESIVGLAPGHQGIAPCDARGVARINSPSDVGSNRDSLMSVMTSALVKSTLRSKTLLVLMAMIANHWMSVMTSALVQSRIRSKV